MSASHTIPAPVAHPSWVLALVTDEERWYDGRVKYRTLVFRNVIRIG